MTLFVRTVTNKRVLCFLTENVCGLQVCCSRRPVFYQTQVKTPLGVPSKNKIKSLAERLQNNSLIYELSVSKNLSFSAFINKFRFLDAFNLLGRILGTQKLKQTKRGYIWYTTLQGVDYEYFIKALKLPNTFTSWFKISELHVWMLLVRLVQDGESSRAVRTGLIEAMWEDAENRSKLLAPENTILFMLDEGLLMDDKALYSALWYYIFDRDCDDPLVIESLISYIRYQVNYLNTINTNDISDDKISEKIWTPLTPHLKVLEE